MRNNLAVLRRAKGWTQQAAADMMGISRAHYIKLEHGKRKLREPTIELASKAFDVSKGQVLEASLELKALIAIDARINNRWDDSNLLSFGPVTPDVFADIRIILEATVGQGVQTLPDRKPKLR